MKYRLINEQDTDIETVELLENILRNDDLWEYLIQNADSLIFFYAGEKDTVIFNDNEQVQAFQECWYIEEGIILTYSEDLGINTLNVREHEEIKELSLYEEVIEQYNNYLDYLEN